MVKIEKVIVQAENAKIKCDGCGCEVTSCVLDDGYFENPYRRNYRICLTTTKEIRPAEVELDLCEDCDVKYRNGLIVEFFKFKSAMTEGLPLDLKET